MKIKKNFTEYKMEFGLLTLNFSIYSYFDLSTIAEILNPA